MEFPHRWVIVKATHNGNSTHKILASWYGGYTGSDSWRLSSGVYAAKLNEESNLFEIKNVSESIYVCGQHLYGMSSYTSSVLNNMKARIEGKNDPRYSLELLSEEDAMKFLQELN